MGDPAKQTYKTEDNTEDHTNKLTENSNLDKPVVSSQTDDTSESDDSSDSDNFSDSQSSSVNESNNESPQDPVHKQLQTRFMELVKEMIDSKCPLPNFELHYMVMYHSDRQGKMVKVKPFLTKEEAEAECDEDDEWEDKYGSDVEYWVLNSKNTVELENYSTGKNKKTEIDIKIPVW